MFLRISIVDLVSRTPRSFRPLDFRVFSDASAAKGGGPVRCRFVLRPSLMDSSCEGNSSLVACPARSVFTEEVRNALARRAVTKLRNHVAHSFNFLSTITFRDIRRSAKILFKVSLPAGQPDC